MYSIFKKTALIKNSKSRSYNFHIINKNTIICDYFDDKGKYLHSLPVTDEKVQDYDVDIDENDVLHLLCLTKTGDLLYFVYRDEQWSNHILTHFDVKSNKYRNLNLKVVRSKIHIFYSTSNLLNHNLWTIQHIVSGKQKWSKNNIISITPGRSSEPFYVSFDRVGGIHLVYTDIDKGKQHVYYTCFNPFLKRWIKSPEKVSEGMSDNYSPFLFIDNTNTIHVTWTTEVNNATRLAYKQKSQISNSKHTWQKCKLPQIYVNCSNPLIIQDNGVLKLLYNQNGQLKYLYSANHGLTWNTDHSLKTINFLSLDKIRFSSNYPYDKFKMKVNYIYGSIKENIQIHYCDSFNKSLNTTSCTPPSNSYYDSNDTSDTVILSENNKLEGEIIKSNTKPLVKLDLLQKVSNQPKEDNAIDTSHNDDYFDKYTVEYNTEPLVDKKEVVSANTNISVLEQVEEIENDNVKEFIQNTKNGLDSLYSNTSLLHEKAKEIEKILLTNVKKLDKKILSNKEFTMQIKNCLTSLEKTLGKCESHNKDISQLLNSLEELYSNNTSDIESIQTKIHQIYDIIENSSTPNFFSKIFSFFK